MQANNQPEDRAMAQLVDLSDEIGADDWTIPRQEITRRRLVKQTPRYKIYKADWFGDVMVYEPIQRQPVRIESEKKALNQRSANRMVPTSDIKPAQPVIEREEICSRLNELCLNLERNQVTSTKKIPSYHEGSIDPDQGVDSAYSSISSTPQYYTKNSQKHNEFEFPHQIEQHRDTTIIRKQETRLESAVVNCTEHDVEVSSTVAPVASSPVVLNRNSFPFQLEQSETSDDEVGAMGRADAGNYNDDQPPCRSSNVSSSLTTSCAWFELNELRLVAHENFILFMGASIEDSAQSLADGMQQTTSLVMQMSHPKSVSLHDLVHQDRTSSVGALSSTSRFYQFAQEPYGVRHLQRPRLTMDAKLNICQQVTDAMTYLHDKNIVHARLTSLNVFIEPNQRVKVSLIDTEERQIASDFSDAASGIPCDETPANRLKGYQTNYGTESESRPTGRFDDLLNKSNNTKVAFNLPALTYLSPEIIKTIKVRPNGGVQMDVSSLTKQADVFSFGTLLFELFEERFPFASTSESFSCLNLSCPTSPSGTSDLFHSLDLNSPTTSTRLGFSYRAAHEMRKQQPEANNRNGNIRVSASELIYLIGSGQIGRRNSSNRKCPGLIEQIISACWNEDTKCRPNFKQLRFTY